MLTDIEYVRNEARGALFELHDWIKPKQATKTLLTIADQGACHSPSSLSFSLIVDLISAYITYEPYGVVLIIGTWNYPVHVTFAPLVGAIAAGNAVIIKPSEVAPASAALLEKLVPKYLDPEMYKVVTGGADTTQQLLREKFDYIMYTGSGSIGKHIHAAAAANLTPCTLELGGKSPLYIDKTVTNAAMAWRRILWGKVTSRDEIDT